MPFESRFLRFPIVVAIALTGCRSPSAPSAPPTSSLTFQVAAASFNPADSGSYTTANATFGATARTNCVPNPNIAGHFCPDLVAIVRGTDNRMCTLIAAAPPDRTFGPGTFTKVGTASLTFFTFNCARAGTTCSDSNASFTVHELKSSGGIVTTLHLTFEQTCLGGFPPALGPFGRATGELWIVNGTTGALG
jgi:hypothetical protein